MGPTDEEDERLVASMRDAWRPLGDEDDLDPLLARVGSAKVVLLGESTHGTHEFYAWREAITRRLVEEKGFSLVAVEGDWPDCRRVDRFVKGRDDGRAEDVLRGFQRWPTWMWANREVASLVRWMRGWNEGHPRRMAGFHGLDVYSLWDSMALVIEYLEARDPEAAERAREAYACFEPYRNDEQSYAAATRWIPETCEEEVVAALREVQARGLLDDAGFDARQNAIVATSAEAYYRAMVRSDRDSWNLRDRHMMETLERLLARDPQARAVVWAHNTHVGDARATDMAEAGMLNLGQLVREGFGTRAFVVGFGTHAGSVVAGRRWDAPMEEMRVPPAQEGSWEDVLHRAGEGQDGYVLLGPRRLPDVWRAPRGQRAIGVVYDPAREAWGNYVPTDLAARYDAFVLCDRTRAVEALRVAVDDGLEPPETYPFGE